MSKTVQLPRKSEAPSENPIIAKMEAEMSAKKNKAPKGATKEKSAVTKKEVATPFVAREAKKGSALYAIAEQPTSGEGRPRNGRKLAAHTHAALVALGMLKNSRPAVAQRTLLSIVGQRAVSWHRGEGNLESAGESGLRLSEAGLVNFRERYTSGKVDGSLANAFLGVILDGKSDTKVLGIPENNVYRAGSM